MTPARSARALARNRLHLCRRVGCPTRVGLRYVFCDRCWLELTRELQVAIYAAYTPAMTGETWRRALRRARLEHEAREHLEIFAAPATRPAAAGKNRRKCMHSLEDALGGARSLEGRRDPLTGDPAGARPPLGVA